MADWIREVSQVHMFRRRFGVEILLGASDLASVIKTGENTSFRISCNLLHCADRRNTPRL